MARPKKLTEADMQKITTDTAEALKSQPKVKVRLPMDPDERKRLESLEKAGKKVQWPAEFVGINGHNFLIQRGKEVEVPKSVYDVLVHAGMV